MYGNFQFTQTFGDGSPSTYSYRKGTLEITENEGTFTLSEPVRYSTAVHFIIQKLKIDELYIEIKGFNKDRHGYVNFLFSQTAFETEVLENMLYKRLQKIAHDTPRFFRQRYGDSNFIPQIANWLASEGITEL